MSNTTTRTFLEAVERADEAPLVFMLDGRILVNPGYHVTEVKALSYHAMDCGGQADQWRETLVQLWSPEEQEERSFMSARKFLSIYRRVAASIPVDEAAEIRFEYGNLERPAVNYHVSHLEAKADQLRVHLRNPAVACKARDRRLQTSGACCAPATAPTGISGTTPEPVLAASNGGGNGCC